MKTTCDSSRKSQYDDGKYRQHKKPHEIMMINISRDSCSFVFCLRFAVTADVDTHAYMCVHIQQLFLFVFSDEKYDKH